VSRYLVVEGVQRAITATGSAHFSFSNNGTLIYIPGPASGTNVRNRTLALLDPKSGALERLKIPPRAYSFPRVSPDHRHVAVSTDDDHPDVWIIDLAGASAPRQLTLGGKNVNPIWSSDGKRVAFQSDREGDQGIWWQEADGTGTAERLTKAEQGVFHVPDSWSPDGKTFSYTAIKNNQVESLWVYSLEEKKATLFEEGAGSSAFSPDGHWLAYQYVDERRIQIFVQPFPATGAKYPVFKGGGHPVWSQDGQELFINAGPGEFGVVSISTRPTFSFGEPVLFSQSGFDSRYPRATPRTYDVAPGKRLIGTVSVEEGTAPGATGAAAAAQPPTQRIQVVLNWFTELLQRVPVK
jgi:Tol biopolymer transport system component